MSNPHTSNSDKCNQATDSFDEALENTADELEAIAEEVMGQDDVKQGLEDPERDDSW